jgi:hypothetical protein
MAMRLHWVLTSLSAAMALSPGRRDIMARTAIATLQTAWDCRWSRLGHRLIGVPESRQPETPWVCVRNGVRTDMDEDACATCPHWELDEPSESGFSATTITADILAPAVKTERKHHPLFHAALVTGAVVAAALFVTVVSVLSAPVDVGFKVAGWLFAAAIVGVAVTTRLRRD